MGGPRGLSAHAHINSAFRSMWLLCLSCNRGFWILHTVSSSYVYQLRSARTSLSRFPEAVGQLTVPNDDSEILSVVPIDLFGAEAVRVTGSLLLSFADGDTACLMGPTHSDPAWAALQHGIPATFALAMWQFAVEGVDEGV